MAHLDCSVDEVLALLGVRHMAGCASALDALPSQALNTGIDTVLLSAAHDHCTHACLLGSMEPYDSLCVLRLSCYAFVVAPGG